MSERQGHILSSAILFLIWQSGTCNLLSNFDAECPEDIHQDVEHEVDLPLIFSLDKLKQAQKGRSSPLYLPGLLNLIRPFIDLVVAQKIQRTEICNATLRHFKISVQQSQKFIRASYGSLKINRVYSTGVQISAQENVIRVQGRFIVTDLTLTFLQYNATVENGDFIGYNMEIKTNIELSYNLNFHCNGTKGIYQLLQEVVGSSSVTFTDRTNCHVVEDRKELNLGRMCGHQALEELTRWYGVGVAVLKFVTPAIFDTVLCAFKVVVPHLIEASTSLSLFLAD